MEAPDKSNAQVASALGVSDTTVGTVRKELEVTSQIGRLEKTIGKDGKARRKPLNLSFKGRGEIRHVETRPPTRRRNPKWS